jgi:hypothetical protein
MIKHAFFLIIVVSVVLLAACGTAQNASGNDANSARKEIYAFSGYYQSSKGVMTALSCYCSDGGTLTLPDQGTVDVCFDGLTEKPENCSKIGVFGHFETIAIEPDETSPCPKGTMEVFIVESFECK